MKAMSPRPPVLPRALAGWLAERRHELLRERPTVRLVPPPRAPVSRA